MATRTTYDTAIRNLNLGLTAKRVAIPGRPPGIISNGWFATDEITLVKVVRHFPDCFVFVLTQGRQIALDLRFKG